MRVIYMAILALLMGSCTLKDLRPKDLLDIDSDAAKERIRRIQGEEWILKMSKAHGGRDQWLKQGTSQIEFRDLWPNFLMKTLAMPWEFSGQRIRLTTQLSTDNMYVEFIDGKTKGAIWGTQNWHSYSVSNGKLSWENDDTTLFWLPTTNYFFHLPMRIQEADKVYFVDEVALGTKTYAKVIASWKTIAPQRNIDQYVLWINKKTHMLDFAEFTVRSMGAGLSGTAAYERYKKTRGISIAHKITLIDKPGAPKESGFTHQFIVQKAYLGKTPSRPFILDPDKSTSKPR